jgi:hypothetical protein
MGDPLSIVSLTFQVFSGCIKGILIQSFLNIKTNQKCRIPATYGSAGNAKGVSISPRVSED